MSRRTARQELCIVMAANPETATALHDYFRNSGLRTRKSCHLQELGTLCVKAHAVVLFPDEFVIHEVIECMRSLRKHAPSLLIVLATADPERLREACELKVLSARTVIMPKPVFGWSLIDTIRGHLQQEH